MGAAELAKLPYSGLAEGFYAVGTGATGAAEALAVMGAGYFGVIMLSSLLIRNPHPSYRPAGMQAETAASVAAKVGKARCSYTGVTWHANTAHALRTALPPQVPDMEVDDIVKTKQFHLLGTTLFCMGTAGMGLLSVAKPMMSEVFSTLLPAVVTSAFASKFLLMLSAGNLGGRMGWAAVSDAIGRRNTFFIFTLGSVPLYFALPTIINMVVSTGSPEPLYLFCASTVTAISIFGGVYAILPAYEADLFGTKVCIAPGRPAFQATSRLTCPPRPLPAPPPGVDAPPQSVSATHGRMLLYSSTAAVVGPILLNKMRGISERSAVTDLLTKVRRAPPPASHLQPPTSHRLL